MIKVTSKEPGDTSNSPPGSHGFGELSTSRATKPQDDFAQVISTPDRGLALYATRKIKAGTLVLAEPALISLDKHEEDDSTAIEREYSKLSRVDQKTYLQLFDAEKSRMSRVVSIYYSNCYNCDSFKKADSDGQQGGSAIGALASRINHSCVPNVQFSFSDNEMRFHAIRDIPRGKELCSNYDKSVFEPAAKRQRKQQFYYGFVCRCEACSPKNEFWERSDERRKAMYDAFRTVQGCEKRYNNSNHLAEDQDPMTLLKDKKLHGDAVVDEALEALTRLEGLLLRECLMGGFPLANTYRSLAKWAERKEDLQAVVKWKTKELETCILGLGEATLRTREIRKKLEKKALGHLDGLDGHRDE
jgi:hypothetical protein